MATTNDITGDSIKSRPNTRKFNDEFDRIFGRKSEAVEAKAEPIERGGNGEPAQECDQADRVGLYGKQGGVGCDGDDGV